MLQPKTYPELLGKALVLEAEPFITLTEDDSPWREGLFLTVVVGLAVGLARLVGGLLLTASLPPAPAVLEALLQGWRQLSVGFLPGAEAAAAEAAFRQAWQAATTWIGYGGGWARLLVLVTAPFWLLLQWLLFSVIGHWAAKAQGGRGAFDQTLGSMALISAPQVLVLATMIPFASVSGLLLAVWAVLIAYRALAVAHDLPWQRAVAAALAPVAVATLLGLLLMGMLGLLVTLGGM